MFKVFGREIELTKKDDEAIGKLSEETCAVLLAILDIRNVLNPTIEIILPSYCMAKDCRVMIGKHGSEALFLDNVLIPLCDTHRQIAIKHATSLGLEVIRKPIIKFPAGRL